MIRAPFSETSTFVTKLSKLTVLNSFLKRVKKGKNENLILVQEASIEISDELNIFLKNKKLETITLYNQKPYTQPQYKTANEKWPCFYFPQKEEKLNIKYIFNIFNTFFYDKIIINNNCCSEMCIIFNETEIYCVQKDENHPFLHSVFKAVELVSQSKKGYLCTGLDAFLYSEPCIACAMALVHGRIKRVFYIYDRIYHDAPFSKLKLCYNKNLNHRYDVFKIKLE
ncbi:adenosine deaminase [Gurleya vavrai]